MHRRNVRGFTLVELLVVVTIIGILASIAAQRIEVKKAAYLATMKSDLRNLVVLQEQYFETHKKYASGTQQLDWEGTILVQEIVVGQKGGWTARARHRALPDHQCAIFMGDVNPVFSPATREGVPACEEGTGGNMGAGGGSGGGGSGGGGKK
jgi:prepilin-type N-terminal cleavage/methylation domain-containing protein